MNHDEQHMRWTIRGMIASMLEKMPEGVGSMFATEGPLEEMVTAEANKHVARLFGEELLRALPANRKKPFALFVTQLALTLSGVSDEEAKNEPKQTG